MPQRDVTLAVLARLARVDVSALRPDTELVADLGFDSATALEFLFEIEEQLGLDMPDDAMTQLNTVGEVLECVARLRRSP